MCRSASSGNPRRCKGSEHSSYTHNRRRKINRRIIAGVADYAAADGAQSTEVEQLRGGNVSAAKAWAGAHGLGAHRLDTQDLKTTDDDDFDGSNDPRVDWLRALGEATARQGEDPREADFLDAFKRSPRVDGWAPDGSNEVQTLALQDGQGREFLGYHKPFEGLDDEIASYYGHDAPLQPVHEVAAWQLARVMGPPYDKLVPVCVLVRNPENGLLGSCSRHLDGEPLDSLNDPLRDVPFQHKQALAFYDSLVGQLDRHPGNLHLDRDTGQLGAFDNGYAFAVSGDEANYSLAVQQRFSSGLAQLTPGERSVLDRLVNHNGFAAVLPLLQRRRAEALLRRANKMLYRGKILDVDDY